MRLFRKNQSEENIKNEEEEPEGIDVFQISKYLRAKLEKVREEIRKEMEPTSLLLRLNERKERLEKDIHQDREKIAEIEDLIPKLKEKKKDLEESVKQKQEEMSRIDEIELILHKI
ncbi:MAG: hypothetical protein ACE5NN_05335 [Candidatus Bathyarchaeia archaeon]